MPRAARRRHETGASPIAAQHTGDSEHAPDLGLERIVFLSDGLFAIALTILVIEVRVPDLPNAASSDQVINSLRALLPRLFAYILSFFTIISLYWVTHWRRFRLIERADVRLAYLNLLLLGFIALIPFPTALIGEHGDTAIAVAIYAGTLAAAGIAGRLTWFHAERAGLLKAGVPRDVLRTEAARGLVVPAVMLLSLLLLPFASPFVIEDSWLLILPIQWLVGRRASH